MNVIRSSIKSQVLDLKTLPVFSPLKRGIKCWGIGQNGSPHKSVHNSNRNLEKELK